MKSLRVVALAAIAACAFAVPASADVEISDQAYVRHDGVTDVTITDCSSDATTPTAGGDGSGERQQNEPASSVAPNNPMHMTAGANDYCPVQTTGDSWAGFYYSSNGGASWVNSLVPGYPTDTSAEGQASPLYRFVSGAGDPVQAWDNAGRLYYAGIAFNRVGATNGSIWVARYNWPMVSTGRTTSSRRSCRGELRSPFGPATSRTRWRSRSTRAEQPARRERVHLLGPVHR